MESFSGKKVDSNDFASVIYRQWVKSQVMRVRRPLATKKREENRSFVGLVFVLFGDCVWHYEWSMNGFNSLRVLLLPGCCRVKAGGFVCFWDGKLDRGFSGYFGKVFISYPSGVCIAQAGGTALAFTALFDEP